MINTRDDLHARLRFLVRVVTRESRHLQATDQRVFATFFSVDRVGQLDDDIEFAERVEAFVSRFGRLQDTLGNKLLPFVLQALGEPTGAAMRDEVEKRGWLGDHTGS